MITLAEVISANVISQPKRTERLQELAIRKIFRKVFLYREFLPPAKAQQKRLQWEDLIV